MRGLGPLIGVWTAAGIVACLLMGILVGKLLTQW
jgi:hypothetical protein